MFVFFRGAVGDKFVFMDDNATCHRTLAVQDCLDSEGIQRLVWPARSSDLNPIENVWDALGRQVADRNYPPTNKNTLIRALTEEWDKLPQQLLDNFCAKSGVGKSLPITGFMQSPRYNSIALFAHSSIILRPRGVSAADKVWRAYPLDPRPDAVALYSGCTPGKRRAWFLSDDRHTASLVGLRGGWRHARTNLCFALMLLCPEKGLVLPTNLTIDEIAKNTCFFILSLPNNEMSGKSPFAIFKALQAMGEPKSVKKMKSGDLLVETNSAVQSKSYLSAKTFLDSPLLVTPHKSLNSSRGVISEPDFPKLPTTIKAGHLNCKIRPYIPNPLLCYKCQRFGHSQTSSRGQLTCSRYASVGHSSTDCTLEPKCVNCTESHPSNSKLCPKWKTEKDIQVIKTNRNIPYVEARKLIAPQLSQSYAQVTKPSTAITTTQTDENITKIVCPPLKLLQSLITILKPTISSSVPAVTKSSTSTQAQLLPSTSSVTVTSPSKFQPPNSLIDNVPTASGNLSISAASSSSTACSVLETTTTTSNTIPTTHPRIQIKPQNPVEKTSP
ncbi:uncharacterized protein TNCV_5011691 [Trichonephila clavipes]|nr:uncharacterized protein TNCV_5011691 [Trichonephila clavipes]